MGRQASGPLPENHRSSQVAPTNTPKPTATPKAESLDYYLRLGSSGTAVYNLVRELKRQGYYTGVVFEIACKDFPGAIGGGGRYDNLIGKFLNETVPAVGFSIGFERIASILTAANYQIPDDKKRIAVIYDTADILTALAKAEEYRGTYEVVLYERPKKLGKLFGKLEEQGFYGCYILNESEDIKVFGA